LAREKATLHHLDAKGRCDGHWRAKGIQSIQRRWRQGEENGKAAKRRTNRVIFERGRWRFGIDIFGHITSSAESSPPSPSQTAEQAK
jgi:hypothetical protein